MYWFPHIHSLCGAYYDGAPSFLPSSFGGAFHLALVVLCCSFASSSNFSFDCPPCFGGSPSFPCMEVHTHSSCVAGCLLASLFFYIAISTLLCSYLLYRPCFSLACVSHTYYLMYWLQHTHSLCGAYYDGAPSLLLSSFGGVSHLAQMVSTLLIWWFKHLA